MAIFVPNQQSQSTNQQSQSTIVMAIFLPNQQSQSTSPEPQFSPAGQTVLSLTR